MDCNIFNAASQQLCATINKEFGSANDKLDSLQTQLYIIAGVGGGVALMLIIIVIALAVQLSSARNRATGLSQSIKLKETPVKNTMGMGGNNGQQTRQVQPPPHSYVQQPMPMTSEEELAQLGFSSYTGHPDSRGMSTSPVVSNAGAAGGVRVLPRNPPPNFRSNAGYM